MSKPLNEILKEHRVKKGMKPKEVAKKIGVKPHSYYFYEQERGTIPKLATLIKMAELYGITIDELVGFDSWAKPSERLPDSKKGVVRVWIFGIKKKMKFHSEGEYKKGKFYLSGEDVTNYVIRWQNIPLEPEI